MNPEPKTEISFEESIKNIMSALPPLVRGYLIKKTYVPIVQELIKEYSLHVDQGGIVERELLLVLMGTEEPADFATSLQAEAQLSEETVKKIVTDLNQAVFLPLQEQLREARSATPGSTLQHPPVKPAPSVQMTKAPAAPMKMGTAPANLPGAPMPSADHLLEDHEEPHIEFKPAMPAAQPPRPVVPAAPPSLPKAQAPQASTQPATPIVKQYASDPYREPIE